MSRGRLTRKKRIRSVIGCAAFIAALALHISIAVYLASDQAGDGIIYSRMAVTLLEQGVYSVDTQAPYTPTLIRLPGYPIFLAGVYSVFGHGNNAPVRVIQGIVFAITCVLVALIAWYWTEGKRRRRRKAAWLAFVLTALCPFTAIFSAVILTETLTMFFLAAMTLAATYGLRSRNRNASWAWWIAAGIIAGVAVYLRPDSGLFAFGLGLTLAVSVFFKRASEITFGRNFASVVLKGILFSVAFALPLVPWTVRNERVFGMFQPLAPAHAEAPGEFVPHGYFLWLRTWINDSRYIPLMQWGLEIQRIKIEQVPAFAFDSDEERSKVAALLDQYNNSDPDHPMVADQKQAQTDSDDNDDSSADDNSDDNGDDQGDDQSDDSDQHDQPQQPEELDLKISPEVDAAFRQIAEERIARHPFHFYVALPAERATSMWFDTHSDYYPFNGELLPMKDLDLDNNQEIWLPLFAVLVWVYTLLAAAGAVFLLISKFRRSWLWLLMVLLLSVPRIAFFGTLENPEPRYLVELFIFAAVLGGIALSHLRFTWRGRSVGIELFYSDG
ncbi:MAG TPA: phospholipid carrier-dependent glycosyltransferase [Pyrinomonadaceae bacterium]|nr:phospholipid carrier-dependent glycosyltransferase [Pyrinomonadaceae bacterium]